MVNARDDTLRFFSDLEAGARIRVLVSPAARTRLPDFGCVLGFLESRGAISFHDVLPFADIACWINRKEIAKGKTGLLIASACAGARTSIAEGKHRDCISRASSPLVCAAKYLRAKKGFTEPFAFLSPCPYKWIEFGNEEMISYNVTISGLQRYLTEKSLDVTQCGSRETECVPEIPGLTVAKSKTLSGTLELLDRTERYHVCMGMKAVNSWLDYYDKEPKLESERTFLEPYHCPRGCTGGACAGLAPLVEFPTKENIHSSAEEIESLFAAFDALIGEDRRRYLAEV